MSKKSRRNRARFQVAADEQGKARVIASPTPRPIAVPQVLQAITKPTAPAARPDLHKYVIPDLRAIGIVTAIVFLVLFIAWLLYQ